MSQLEADPQGKTGATADVDEFAALLPANLSFNNSLEKALTYTSINTEDDGVCTSQNKAELNFSILELLHDNRSVIIPDAVLRSVHSLRDAGINKIAFRYDIGSIAIDKTNKQYGIENALVEFMDEHGSKYVRK